MSYSKRISVISNSVIVFVLIFVFGVFFTPINSSPMYGGEEYGAIYNGNRDNKNVSLMFNVYENTDIVNKIVDLLDEYESRATFFVGGCWADDNEKTLNRISEHGHEIGNHGYFHKDHAKLTYEQNKEEIINTNKIITSLTSVNSYLFAPPSGSFSNETLKVCYELGLKVIMWSKDTIDWRDKDFGKIFYRATNEIKNGDLVLMHPKQHTLLALPSILEYYKSMGYSVVTVSKNLNI